MGSSGGMSSSGSSSGGSVSCPAPSDTQAFFGASSCDLPDTTQCPVEFPGTPCADGQPSTEEGDCACDQGHWMCETVAYCPAPTTCPAPGAVQQGVQCASPGQQCPGNPQPCDGAVFYDAFQCEGGSWNDVAVTECEEEGGVSDGGAPEGDTQ